MDSFVYSTVDTDGSSKSREFGFGLAGSGQFGPVAATVSASLDVTGSSSHSSTKSDKVAGTKLTVKTFSSRVTTEGGGAVCETGEDDKQSCVSMSTSLFDVTSAFADAVMQLPTPKAGEGDEDGGQYASTLQNYLPFVQQYGDVVVMGAEYGAREAVSTEVGSSSSKSSSKKSVAASIAGTRKYLDKMSVPAGVKVTTTYTKESDNAIGQTIDLYIKQSYDTRKGTPGHSGDEGVDLIEAGNKAVPKVEVNLGFSRSSETSSQAAMEALENKLTYYGGDTRKLSPGAEGADRSDWLKSIEEQAVPVSTQTAPILSALALRVPCVAGDRTKPLADGSLTGERDTLGAKFATSEAAGFKDTREVKAPGLGQLLAGALGAASSAKGKGAFGAITDPKMLDQLAVLTERRMSCTGDARGCPSAGRPFLDWASSRGGSSSKEVWKQLGGEELKHDAEYLGEQAVEHALLTGFLPLPKTAVLVVQSGCSLAGGTEGKTVAVAYFEPLDRFVAIVVGGKVAAGNGARVMELGVAFACDSAQSLAQDRVVLHAGKGKAELQFLREAFVLAAAASGELQGREAAGEKTEEKGEFMPLFFGQGGAPEGMQTAWEAGVELAERAKVVAKATMLLQDEGGAKAPSVEKAKEEVLDVDLDDLMQLGGSAVPRAHTPVDGLLQMVTGNVQSRKASVRGFARRALHAHEHEHEHRHKHGHTHEHGRSRGQGHVASKQLLAVHRVAHHGSRGLGKASEQATPADLGAEAMRFRSRAGASHSADMSAASMSESGTQSGSASRAGTATRAMSVARATHRLPLPMPKDECLVQVLLHILTGEWDEDEAEEGCKGAIAAVKSLSAALDDGELEVPEEWNLQAGKQECILGGVENALRRQEHARAALKELPKLQKQLNAYAQMQQDIVDAMAKGGMGASAVCAGQEEQSIEQQRIGVLFGFTFGGRSPVPGFPCEQQLVASRSLEQLRSSEPGTTPSEAARMETKRMSEKGWKSIKDSVGKTKAAEIPFTIQP